MRDYRPNHHPCSPPACELYSFSLFALLHNPYVRLIALVLSFLPRVPTRVPARLRPPVEARIAVPVRPIGLGTNEI